MSVVNQMLKDLQRREYRPPQGAVRLVLGAAANDALGPKRDPRPLLILLMLAASLGFALATDWQRLSEKRDINAAPAVSEAPAAIGPSPGVAAPLPLWEPSTTAHPPTQVSPDDEAGNDTAASRILPQTAEVPAVAPPEPALLGSIRSGWQPGRTRFVFKFRQWPTQIRLDESQNNRVSIHFAAATLRGEPPSRAAGDRQLGEIKVKAGAQDLGFEFSASDGSAVRAEYHRVSRDGDWPHWVVLDLHWRSPAVAAPAEAAAPAQVDAPEPRLTPTPSPAAVLEKRPQGPTPQTLGEQALADAHAALGEGREAAAVAFAQRALSLAPTSVAAIELYAGLLLRQGDPGRAEGLLRTGLQHHPAHPGMSLLLARIMIEQSREAQALELLSGLSGKVLADPEFLALRAATLQRLQRHQGAVADYMAALRQIRGQGLWWLGLAISLEALDHHRDARAAYDEALSSGMLAGEVRSYAEARLRALDRYKDDPS